MDNKKNNWVKRSSSSQDAATKLYIDNLMVLKADKTELNSYILKSGLTSNLDMKNNKIINLKTATSGNDAVNFTQLNSEMSNYLHLTGETMKGDIKCNSNNIYGIE